MMYSEETLKRFETIKLTNGGKIPIEKAFDLNTDTQRWYDIPGFNGYQMSTSCVIRSYKYRKSYPFGILICPKSDGDIAEKVIYELTDNDNVRIKISLYDIENLIYKNDYRCEYNTLYAMDFKSPRNKRMFINQDPEHMAKKKGVVRKATPVKDEPVYSAKFTITNNPKSLGEID